MGIRVAIAGVGNCANSLVQGVTYYQHATPGERIPGLMNVEVGGYHIRDIEFVAAFDIHAAKVGVDLAEAIWAAPNNTIKFAEVEAQSVVVQRGPTLDGIGKYCQSTLVESEEPVVEVAQVLKERNVDVLISYLPVGSSRATEFYANAALEAGTAFINCVPVFIASNPEWAERFRQASLPIIGDDIKSQVGATIVHRSLARLFEDRGVPLQHTYQLNVGGNMDFLNMMERERLHSKKQSKTNSVNSQLDEALTLEDIHISPSDHIPFLTDRKVAFIRLEGKGFGDVPLTAEMRLEVWDSPNSAGVVIDALRCAKVAKDRGIGGPLLAPSAYFMKSPPTQYRDSEALTMLQEFLSGNN